MWRRAFGVWLALMVASVVAASGGRLAAQQLHTVPFDEALSIYVGHYGTWMNYNTGQEEEEEIEDAVAVFQSWEQVSDDPDIWLEHQVNNPQLPEGWVFFTPVEGEPMELHVIIRDTQNRLGQVVISDWETSATVGSLSANAEGSEIDGTVIVNPEPRKFHLDVKARSDGLTLFQAGARQTRADDACVCSLMYGWMPNRGDEHPCPVPIGAPYGDPESVEGKVSSEGVGGEHAYACAGPVDFNNDASDPAQAWPKYNLLDKKLVKAITTTPPPGPAGQRVEDAIGEAHEPFLYGEPFLQPWAVKPYSKGTAHWGMTVIGEMNSLICYPYIGDPEYRLEFQARLQGETELYRSEGEGEEEPALVVAGVITAAWAPGKRLQYQALAPFAIGDAWGLRAETTAGPDADPEENITAPVTFELWADLPPGFIGGTGLATKDEADTTPAPPYPMPPEVALEFPEDGENQGRCTVELGKGWKWKATGEPSMAPYSGGELAPFPVVGPVTKRIECHLEMLLCLNIKTVSEGGENVEANVELERQVEGGWWPEDSGQSTEQPNGEYIWSPANPLSPGTYRARAAGMGGWSDWLEFPVIVGLELTKVITVPEEPMGPH